MGFEGKSERFISKGVGQSDSGRRIPGFEGSGFAVECVAIDVLGDGSYWGRWLL
jgi:hypothetical protein